MPGLSLISHKADFSRAQSDIWKGDAARSKSLLQYCFPYGAVELMLAPPAVEWAPKKATPQWMQEVYGFSWLRDLAQSEETTEAVKLARFYLFHWMRNAKSLPSVAQHPDVAGERIALCMYYGEWLLEHAHPAFRRRFYRRLHQDVVRHWRRVHALREKAGFGAIKGAMAGIVLLNDADAAKEGIAQLLAQLHRSIALRVMADGGHVSRCPEQQLASLRNLVEIRELLKGAQAREDDVLDTTIHRMAAVMRLWLHGDGRMALFNDALEGDAAIISAVLDKTGGYLSVPREAADSGFQRLAMKDSLAIMDTGIPQRTHSRTHFGTLSFEFSHLDERIIVNCGAFRGSDLSWKEAVRATAAHSTLVINGKDSVPSLPQELLGISCAPVISVEHVETPSSIEVTAVYNGYSPDFRLKHQRKLVLCDNGKRLEGQDSLLPEDDSEEEGKDALFQHLSASIRFHLHPEIRATKTGDGGVLLKSPSGKQWFFSCGEERSVSLLESVYLGKSGRPKKTHQLVVNISQIKPEECCSWSLERRK